MPVAAGGETRTAPLDDLIVVAEFRDTIYPGLVSTGRVSRGGHGRPWHTVINGENYHVLKALTWTHRGTAPVAPGDLWVGLFDAIDPPGGMIRSYSAPAR
mgnify:CR=1 FL=1